jgi:plastocyanin
MHKRIRIDISIWPLISIEMSMFPRNRSTKTETLLKYRKPSLPPPLKRLRVLRFLASTEFLGVVLFVFAAGFPPFDDVTEVDLTLHMLQHVLIVIAGVLIAYPYVGRRMLSEEKAGWRPGLALAASILIILFWHLPSPWDAAVLNPLIHVAEHLSFLLVGFLAGSWLLLLSDSGKIGALFAAFFGHMGYAVALISPWGVQVYPLYSLANQATLGWVLLLTGPILVVGVAYVIARNPEWLGGYSESQAGPRTRRKTFLNKTKTPRWLAPALTLALVAVMVGYFATTAYAISAAQPPSGGGTTIFIVETPVSWQYSPQNIKVVVGVNATITWVSHSISYDTVTDRSGTFGSGPMAPGQSFEHTFSEPGVYAYYCMYHPWMTGTVTVEAATK